MLTDMYIATVSDGHWTESQTIDSIQTTNTESSLVLITFIQIPGFRVIHIDDKTIRFIVKNTSGEFLPMVFKAVDLANSRIDRQITIGLVVYRRDSETGHKRFCWELKFEDHPELLTRAVTEKTSMEEFQYQLADATKKQHFITTQYGRSGGEVIKNSQAKIIRLLEEFGVVFYSDGGAYACRTEPWNYEGIKELLQEAGAGVGTHTHNIKYKES